MEPLVSLIEPRLYRKIFSRIPIVCVDLIIRHKGYILLVKRKNHPLRGEWWVVGGRLLLHEDPIDAVHRKAKEEVGIEVSDPSFVAYLSDVYPRNSFERVEYQTVSLVFECEALQTDITLDSQSSEYKWSVYLPERFLDKLKWCERGDWQYDPVR